MPFHAKINGQSVSLPEPGNRLLLHTLRDLGLTGSKEGCAEGECGACAVAIGIRTDHGALEYRAVNSCLMMTFEAEGMDIVTVEGIAAAGGIAGSGGIAATEGIAASETSALHPVQEAMVRCLGSQCGYCTPGFVVGMFAEYERAGRSPGTLDAECVSGNLCRCTGYRPILKALEVGQTTPIMRRAPEAQTRKPLPVLANSDSNHDSKPTQHAVSLEHALRWLQTNPNGQVVAGATDVLSARNQLGTEPRPYLSLTDIVELKEIRRDGDMIHIGAMTTLRTLEDAGHAAPDEWPELLRALWPLFASRLIRERATLGGNLGTASPIGDSAPALLALDASVELARWQEPSVVRRSLPLASYFLGYRKTAKLPDELITQISFRLPTPGALERFNKVSKRVHDDISSVAMAVVLEHQGGAVLNCRIGLGGVGPTPMRALQTEALLKGLSLDASSIEQAAQQLAHEIAPMDDFRASAHYRRAVAQELLRRCLAEVA